jgi:hypothetical protein
MFKIIKKDLKMRRFEFFNYIFALVAKNKVMKK